MTFFYDLNKKLDEIRATPSKTHGQLNERDEGKPGKNFEKIAKDAGERYGSKAAGERVAGAVRNKLKAQGKLEEEGMSRAAKGYEKYGKEGMEALAKAGREGKPLDKIRAKYDKYDNEVDEGLIGTAIDKIKPYAKKALNVIAPDDETLIKDLQKKVGVPQTGIAPKVKKPAPDSQEQQESAAMTPKQKSFAKLAPPTDKITFADKIAGAKKEVDEMLGDVAADAMKKAVGGRRRQETDEGWDDMLKDTERRRNAPKVGDVRHGSKHDVEEIPGGRRVTRRTDPNTGYSVGADDDTPASGEKRGRGRPKGSKAAIGAKGPSGKSKLMTKEGSDHGQAQQIYDDLADIRAIAKQAQRGGDFPQGFASRLESVLYAAMTLIKNQQPNDAQVREEELDEKAVSKKQQRFMGMVHATQKGEKAPSKEVAKVAKSMGKKDAEDFAATKHKGLPEKKKPEGKKKEKTEEAGGTGTPTASSGFSYGKGIYDSMNRELEEMIAEGMNVNMSMNTDANGGPSKSLTVTATDEDALKLGQLLKMAGLSHGDNEGYGGEGYKSACGCGTPDCGCNSEEVEEAYGDNVVSDNQPDWPTNTETSDDALQYSGGLNKPKSSGMATIPVTDVQVDGEDNFSKPARMNEEELDRMMEMAGVKKKTDEEKTEEGNLFTGNLAKARAAGKKQADLDGDGDMEKVDEGILSATANLWSEYKGKYGV